MMKRFTQAGAMVAMRAVTGHYFLGLGTGETQEGLVGEVSVIGYARQPVTIVARRATGTNAAALRFGTFSASAGRVTHGGLFTAADGGTCIWVGPLPAPLEVTAGGMAIVAANALTLQVGLVGSPAVEAVAPQNTAVPAITGTTRVGNLLTASTGTWTGTSPITFALQWQRGTTAIPGATAATYTAQTADVGQALRVVVTASNSGGAAEASSAATAPISEALIAPANTVLPTISGAASEGELLTGSTGTWTGTPPITYAFQWQRGATAIPGATATTYLVQAADVDQTLRVVVTASNAAGMTEAASASTSRILAAPLPGITIVTPTSPLEPSAALTVSGSYSGTMTAASVAWVQNGNPVGEPIAITGFSGGAWTATITSPEVPGVYRLRAVFNGTGPTATSDDVTIGTSDDVNLATFRFDGSGDGADTVAIFGHSFPAGALHPTASIVLRRADNNVALRTQMTPLATWPDGTVRTAVFAGELPALSDGTLLQVRLRRHEAHSSPGPNLTWAGALSGRTVVIRTWAPGNTTTPLWTYDVAAALLSSTDDWMTGPLAINRRVAIDVPTSATNAPAGGAGPTSIRLVVDVTATKDGMIEVDAQFRNDAFHQAGGGHARYGYTIEVDGTIIYDQRPATGPARDHLQYNWWMRRRAKKGAKVYDYHTTYRPMFFPDYDVLVDSRFLLPYGRDLFNPLFEQNRPNTLLTQSQPYLNDPYWAWGVVRFQGAVGGRPEIGYKTAEQVLWAFNRNATNRKAQLLVHYQCEAFATAGVYYRDVEVQAPVAPDRWPLGSVFGGAQNPGTDATVLPRTQATGLPASQPHQNNQTDHISPDQAHRGPHYGITAILSGRRAFYDLLAHRAAECPMTMDRFNGVTHRGDGGVAWRGLTPNHTTGVAWAPRPSGAQQRSIAWQVRDVMEAEYALPDNHPRRSFYRQNAEAYLNVQITALPIIQAAHNNPAFGYLTTHTDGGNWSPYMVSFYGYGMTLAVRAGIGGAAAQTAIANKALFRLNAIAYSDQIQRTILAGKDLLVYNGNQPGQTFEDVTTFTSPNFTQPTWPGNDWLSGEGNDYFLNGINNLALFGTYIDNLEVRAAARDALVRNRSERVQASGLPSVAPANFQNNGNSMTNNVFPSQWTWNTIAAPSLVQPATMNVEVDVAAGALVGLVDWTGSVPRCTTASNANNDAFEIVSQPAGNPFTITRGGAIRRSATGTLVSGNQTLRVRARTIDGNAPQNQAEVTRWSNTVTVTVNGTANAPMLSADQSVTIAENRPVDSVVATFTYTGTTATSASITGGNAGNYFSAHLVSGKRVEIRVAQSMTGIATTSRAPTLSVTNAAGTSAARTLTISIQPPVDPPVITAGQTFTIAAASGAGVSPMPATVPTTGGAPTAFSIISGNGSGAWAISNAGVLTTAAALGGINAPPSFTLGIRASNLGGQDEKTVSISVAQAQTVWASTAPSGLFVEAWGIARRIATNYSGPLIRVRRATDNAERDIGSAGGALDTAALASFIGSSQGFIRRVYGQIGGYHLEQATAGNQFQITAAGGTLHRLTGATGGNRACARRVDDGGWMTTGPVIAVASFDRSGIGAVANKVTGTAGGNGMFLVGSQGSAVDNLIMFPDFGGPTHAWELQRNGSERRFSIPNGISQNQPYAMALRMDAGAANGNLLRGWLNAVTANGANALSNRLGAINPPAFQNLAFTVNSRELASSVASRPMEWTECYLVHNITDGEMTAVVAEQRAFYGF